MPLHDPPYCRTRAAECERLAANATSAEARETLTYLAHRWRMLAEQDEPRQTPVQSQRSMPPRPTS